MSTVGVEFGFLVIFGKDKSGNTLRKILDEWANLEFLVFRKPLAEIIF